MQTSPYAHALPAILAEVQQAREAADDNSSQNQPAEQTDGDETPDTVVYVYPLEGGGVVLTHTPIEDEDDPLAPPIVEAVEQPETRDQRPLSSRQPPYLLHLFCLLVLFVGLDNLETVFAQFAPTVTVTITPTVVALSTTATLSVGAADADLPGRVLPALTVSQSATVQASGHGHQDATRATGIVTFYNASFVAQTVPAGSVLSAGEGVTIATSQTVSVPANSPPQDGMASVSAYAVEAGARGNIPALALDGMLSGSLFVKNRAPFTGGRDARNFHVVTQADPDQPVVTLKAQVLQSMQAAFQRQGRPGEQVLVLPCRPTTTADHRPGEEAQQVHITVSATCRALVYQSQDLTIQATRHLSSQAVAQLGAGYRLAGTISVRVTRVSLIHDTTRSLLSWSAVGSWVYQLNERQVQALIAGQPRRTALHLLATTPGVQSVSIAGASDTPLLPADPDHLHVFILVEG